MLHFIQDAIVISLFWIVMRFRPDFILASFNTIGNMCFKKGINRKSIYKTHGRVCLLYVPILCLFWNRIGNDVLHSRKGWVQGCRQQHQHVKQLSFYYSCKKSTSLCYPTLFNYWTLILPEKCLPHTSTSSRTRLMTYDCKMTFWFVFLTSKLNYYFDLF